MAGFLGKIGPADVHKQIRMPNKEMWANVEMPDGLLEDLLFWNDLYDYDG